MISTTGTTTVAFPRNSGGGAAAKMMIMASTTAAAAAAAAAMITLRSNNHITTDNEAQIDDDNSIQPPPPHSKMLQVNFLEKLRAKSYLQSSSNTDPESSSSSHLLPHKLRILAIDLPELSGHILQGSTGKASSSHSQPRHQYCQVSTTHVFPDDIAPSKRIPWSEPQPPPSDDNPSGPTTTKKKKNLPPNQKRPKQQHLEIMQKTIAKSLLQCMSSSSTSSSSDGSGDKRIGLEILQVSLADLNPYQLRKTHQVGTYRYDPGKYYDPAIGRANAEKRSRRQDDETDQDTTPPALLLDPEEEQREAPWNQYAWMEEIQLRIRGKVGWASSLEPAGRWGRLKGHVYQRTHFAQWKLWEWMILPQFAKSDPDGTEGGMPHSRASQKPHVVLANGAALQKVPSALRLLQKECQQANIPLFVVYDPRSWGGNTHANLNQALVDVRTTLKHRFITQALQVQGSTAFTRGRVMGQLETKAAWAWQDQKRHAKELVLFNKNKNKAQLEDWSLYDVNRLERRLGQRGLIDEKMTSDGEGGSILQKFYKPALVELAKRCLSDVQEQELQQGQQQEEAASGSNAAASPTNQSKAATTSRKSSSLKAPVPEKLW